VPAAACSCCTSCGRYCSLPVDCCLRACKRSQSVCSSSSSRSGQANAVCGGRVADVSGYSA
jgi:hypothetical protein